MRIILAATIGAAALAGPPPAQVAQQICSSLPQAGAQCVEQMTATAQTIVDGCNATAAPETPAYRDCIQAGVAAAVQQAGGGAGSPTAVAPSALRVAGDLCTDLQTAFGGGFAKRFGTPAACAQKLNATATSITTRCSASQQPGTDAFAQCMQNGVDAVVATRTIAKRICTAARSPIGCETKLQATAARIQALCGANVRCVAQAVKAAARKQKGK